VRKGCDRDRLPSSPTGECIRRWLPLHPQDDEGDDAVRSGLGGVHGSAGSWLRSIASAAGLSSYGGITCRTWSARSSRAGLSDEDPARLWMGEVEYSRVTRAAPSHANLTLPTCSQVPHNEPTPHKTTHFCLASSNLLQLKHSHLPSLAFLRLLPLTHRQIPLTASIDVGQADVRRRPLTQQLRAGMRFIVRHTGRGLRTAARMSPTSRNPPALWSRRGWLRQTGQASRGRNSAQIVTA